MSEDKEPGVEAALSVPSSRARVSSAAVLHARNAALELLAAGHLPRSASRTLQQRLGISRSYANRHVAAALEELERDARSEPLSSKRARMVATLHAQIRRALALKRQYVTNGEVVEYDAPDLKAANGALALLAQVEGVRGPPQDWTEDE